MDIQYTHILITQFGRYYITDTLSEGDVSSTFKGTPADSMCDGCYERVTIINVRGSYDLLTRKGSIRTL